MHKGLKAIRMSDLALVGLVALVAAVGILSAFAVKLFEGAIDLLLELGYHIIPSFLSAHGIPGWTAWWLFPAALGFAVAGAKALVSKPDRHHSVPLVIVAMNKREGRISPISTFLKTVSSILTLGAGGSMGREGPVVLLGGGIGSTVGQAMKLPKDWTNTLVLVGSGAAIATAFHAPITGAFFAMEIVLIEFNARSFALAALACVAAVQVSGLMQGAPPFPIPAYQMTSSWEIPLYLLCGLVVALVARLYIKVLYGSEHWGKTHLMRIPTWVKPAISGILFGSLALLIPQTLAAGYDTISVALAGGLTLGTLLLLLAGKLLAIGLTSGGGWPGGVFTPALFLGAMAGGAYGAIVHALLPGLVTQPAIYAVVGMATMIAGATQAPLTAMTLIFEVTQDYHIALPAMLACAVAAVFSHRLSPFSIDTVHLTEHGILLPWQVHDLRAIKVGDAMSRDVHTVFANMQLRDVIAVMQFHRHGGYPVLDDEGHLAGMVTLRDVREVPLQQRLDKPVTEVMSKHLITVAPDATLAEAAMLMAKHGVGRVPVVDPAAPAHLLGIISRSDVLRAYPSEDEVSAEAYLER